MWSLIKGVFYLFLFFGLALFAYLVPLEGRTLYERGQELMDRDVLTSHFERLKYEAQKELAGREQDKVASKPERKPQKGAAKASAKPSPKAGHAEVSEADKKSLDALVRGIE